MTFARPLLATVHEFLKKQKQISSRLLRLPSRRVQQKTVAEVAGDASNDGHTFARARSG
jgi:hypothetical protein